MGLLWLVMGLLWLIMVYYGGLEGIFTGLTKSTDHPSNTQGAVVVGVGLGFVSHSPATRQEFAPGHQQ